MSQGGTMWYFTNEYKCGMESDRSYGVDLSLSFQFGNFGRCFQESFSRLGGWTSTNPQTSTGKNRKRDPIMSADQRTHGIVASSCNQTDRKTKHFKNPSFISTRIYLTCSCSRIWHVWTSIPLWFCENSAQASTNEWNLQGHSVSPNMAQPSQRCKWIKDDTTSAGIDKYNRHTRTGIE